MDKTLPKKQNKKWIGSLVLCQNKPEGIGIILNLIDENYSIFWVDLKIKDKYSIRSFNLFLKEGIFKLYGKSKCSR